MLLKKVLVVEDSDDDQFLAKIAFTSFDKEIEVVCVSDGVEASELLAKDDFCPNLILLDINMPRMNGLEFLERHGDDDTPPIVVMLTSSEQDSDKTKSLSFGSVMDYMVKPIRKENVAKFVELLESL